MVEVGVERVLTFRPYLVLKLVSLFYSHCVGTDTVP